MSGGDRLASEDHSCETASLKSTSTFSDSFISVGSTSSSSAAVAPRAHSFVRTHFHRATQCDFCGKKIWLKDAMQCQECSMCCHKKCIAKCQNATVCGPVDCSSSMPSASASSSSVSTTVVSRPEFTITQADNSEMPPAGSEAGCASDEAASLGGDQSSVPAPASASSTCTGPALRACWRRASSGRRATWTYPASCPRSLAADSS